MTPDPSRIPRPAAWLGWAGVIPFAGLAAAALLPWPAGWASWSWPWPLPVGPLAALLGYGAVILSFMGGAQWGLTVRAGDGRDRAAAGYAISVGPALVAWVALGLGGTAGLVLLAAGFAALLAYDLRTVGQGLAPAWYGRLRVGLTGAVVLLLAVATFAAR